VGRRVKASSVWLCFAMSHSDALQYASVPLGLARLRGRVALSRVVKTSTRRLYVSNTTGSNGAPSARSVPVKPKKPKKPSIWEGWLGVIAAFEFFHLYNRGNQDAVEKLFEIITIGQADHNNC
jgi:hypothetical protein